MCKKKNSIRHSTTYIEDKDEADWEPDYKSFVVVGEGGIGMVFDKMCRLEIEWMFPNEEKIIHSVLSNDSQFLISDESELLQYSVMSKELVKEHGQMWEATTRLFASNSKFIFGCTITNVILKYSLKQKKIVADLGKLVDKNIVAMHATNNMLFIADDDCNLIQYHIELEKTLHKFESITKAPISCIKSFKNNLIVTGLQNSMIKINIGNKKISLDFGSLNFTMDEENNQIEEEVDEENPVTTTAIELNNYIVITGHSNGAIKIWDIKTGELLSNILDTNKFPPHSDALTTLSMNKDFLFSGSHFGDYKTYSVKERKIVKNGGKILQSILFSVMI